MGIKNILRESFKFLPERYKKILEERFGLKTGVSLSLEAIGKKRGITRERVRQIVSLGLKKIVVPEKFEPYLSWAKDEIRLWGGVKEESVFAREAEIHFFSGRPKEKFFFVNYKFLLLASGEIKQYNQNERFKPFFYLGEKDLKRFENIASLFEKELRQREILSSEKFAGVVEQISKKYGLTESVVCSYIALLKSVRTNILGEVGFSSLRRIKPRGIKDQLHLVFQKVGQPLHFSEAVKIIEGNNYWPKPLNIHTVHNELIKDGRFVLVGRGIYALREWGYLGGTVKDALERILSASKRSLSFEEIASQVKKELRVKDETIKFNLKRFPQFQLLPDGRWTLKKNIKPKKA